LFDDEDTPPNPKKEIFNTTHYRASAAMEYPYDVPDYAHMTSLYKKVGPALVDLLKASFTKSNFSIAFPYVAALEEDDTMANSLVSGFTKSCGDDMGFSNVAFLESCSVEGANYKKLADLSSVH
ncbi:hypothetical protein, partial [Escherichia coli]